MIQRRWKKIWGHKNREDIGGRRALRCSQEGKGSKGQYICSGKKQLARKKQIGKRKGSKDQKGERLFQIQVQLRHLMQSSTRRVCHNRKVAYRR